MTGKAFGIALIAAFMLLAANGLAKAATAGEINASVNATLDRFYRQIPGARELSARATGVLVFPPSLCIASSPTYPFSHKIRAFTRIQTFLLFPSVPLHIYVLRG
jgi:hypothetical protein